MAMKCLNCGCVPLSDAHECPPAAAVVASLPAELRTETIPPLVSPWHPMSDARDLKHLGKLAEEASELGSATARCLIQGIRESHPVTGKRNDEWLEDEIADVVANIELVTARFCLNRERMRERAEAKLAQLASWHEMA